MKIEERRCGFSTEAEMKHEVQMLADVRMLIEKYGPRHILLIIRDAADMLTDQRTSKEVHWRTLSKALTALIKEFNGADDSSDIVNEIKALEEATSDMINHIDEITKKFFPEETEQ